MNYQTAPYDLDFKFNAGTSRGILRQKRSWFLQLQKEGKKGVGECGILKGLSIENFDNFDQNINSVLRNYVSDNQVFDEIALDELPSLKFGLEMATKDLELNGDGIIFNHSFVKGEKSIPINGLVWMGEYQFMFNQIKEKIDSGYSCIKIKIGAIDFDKELSLLKYIRSEFKQNEIEIRVDANGAFLPENALEKLKMLSSYNLHSIEQPIKQGQWNEMAILCDSSPLPIALDEELIGVTGISKKKQLLDTISPQYIILKPSLLGGYASSEEWIRLADNHQIGYWITSALESNIGLSAIAQWTYDLIFSNEGKNSNQIPQGLGTGQLYHNNFEGPLYIKNGAIHFDPEVPVYKNFKLFR